MNKINKAFIRSRKSLYFNRRKKIINKALLQSIYGNYSQSIKISGNASIFNLEKL